MRRLERSGEAALGGAWSVGAWGDSVEQWVQRSDGVEWGAGVSSEQQQRQQQQGETMVDVIERYGVKLAVRYYVDAFVPDTDERLFPQEAAEIVGWYDSRRKVTTKVRRLLRSLVDDNNSAVFAVYERLFTPALLGGREWMVTDEDDNVMFYITLTESYTPVSSAEH